MNRSQSKYFATAARMDKAFLELIAKKDIDFITVKEICEKAGVNRSTFYLHYETVADIIEESIAYIFDRFLDFMPENTRDFLNKLEVCPLEELYLIIPEYLSPYLMFVKENRNLFKASLKQSSVLKMNEAYLKLNRVVLTPILDRFRVPVADREYMMRFYISGLIAIIEKWLEDDCKESTERIISIMQICINHKNAPYDKYDMHPKS